MFIDSTDFKVDTVRTDITSMDADTPNLLALVSKFVLEVANSKGKR